MNPQTLKYLQKDQIGKVIATGLAQLYINKPNKPVKYLAEWLNTYSRNQKQMARLAKLEKQKNDVLKAYEKQQQEKTTAQNQKKAKKQQQEHSHDKFKEMVRIHQHHQDLLQEILAEFIEKNTKATGVYIGELNHPYKEVTEEDADELAHLDTAAQKVINYIGSSSSHQKLMRGKSLKTSQGVTASTFALLEQAPAPVIGEDGQQIAQPQKPKYLFVANVVKNTSIHYFKIPKLGSYLAVPVVCNQYLTEANFDTSLHQKLEYIKQSEQLEKNKKAELEQLLKQKQEFEKKIVELTEKNADQAHLQPIRAQLKQVEQAIAQKQKESIEQKQATLTSNKKSYVFCADTLGKDKQLDQGQIDFIVGLVNHFKDSWESKEKQLLKKDVDSQVENLKTADPETLKQELTKALEMNQEEQKQLHAITDESKKQHRQLQLQLGKLKTQLTTNPVYLQSFLHLKKFRLLKYRELVQNLFFFLSYNKDAINAPKKASLNWRQIKNKLVTEQTFHKILSYSPLGAKKQQYKPYAKTPHLADIFDKFDEEEVFKYNAALGAITQWVKKSLELRELDVEARKHKFEADSKNREKILEDNEKVQAKLKEDLEKHVGSLSADDAANFNEADWKADFYTKHPLQEVPAETAQDIDNDM